MPDSEFGSSRVGWFRDLSSEALGSTPPCDQYVSMRPWGLRRKFLTGTEVSTEPYWRVHMVAGWVG
jgi:hypothetical protein